MRWKKLYYVPGFISLIGMSVLLLVLSPREYRPQTTIRMFLLDDKIHDDGIIRNTKYDVYKEIKNKKIITVSLTDKPLTDNIDLNTYRYNLKLGFIEREIQRLKFANDASMVIKVELGDSNNYADFIWLMNQTMIYQIKRFALVDSSFYFLPNPPPRKPSNELNSYCCGSDVIKVEPDKKDPTTWDKIKLLINKKISTSVKIFKKNYLLITGFLLLILLPSLVRLRNITQRPQGTQR